jgi:asparagine synthase (glutamine-hydrolysing)
MRATMRHRGPNSAGIHTDGSVGLGFNRLSIIDLSPEGDQPMCNEDGSVWIVFNGEIYNYQDLRQDLISRGHRFRSNTDTETIVHAWEEFGEACLDRLRGMYAFVIWDSRAQTLFGARDRLGIKPFYYHFDGATFSFASELKSLLQLPWIDREVNPAALTEYLRHRYSIGPHTILRNIWKLQPGHCVRVDRSGMRTRQYWEAPVGPSREVRLEDALAEFEQTMLDALRIHLISDVPLGVFLSGGVDSSAIVALMRKLGVSDIKTFSIGYDTSDSELPYAAMVVKRYSTQHHELHLSAEKFRDLLSDIVYYMDEPMADDSAIPFYCLSRYAKEHITVALSGEGADEILAGYGIYHKMLTYESLNRIPGAAMGRQFAGLLPRGSKLRKYTGMLGLPLEERYQGVSRYFTESEIRRLVSGGVPDVPDGCRAAYARTPGLSHLRRMCHLDLTTWLPDNQLLKGDRMGMANSLEVRVPFLDHKVVECAMLFPDRLKIQGGVGKYLLKKMLEPLLPHEVLYRPKKGFPTPIKTWMRNELAGYARETLLARNNAASEFFQPSEIEALLRNHQEQDRSGHIYALLCFNEWHRVMVDAAVGAGSN